MKRSFGCAPTTQEFAALAQAALNRLPAEFRAHLGDIAIAVEDFADNPTLQAVGLENPFELTGLYEGVALTERSIKHTATPPTRIRLFRRPILDEWAERGDESLEHLIAHVMIHEVGHHFGLSDEDMHALEDAAAEDAVEDGPAS